MNVEEIHDLYLPFSKNDRDDRKDHKIGGT
jgi:hypothetical protein